MISPLRLFVWAGATEAMHRINRNFHFAHLEQRTVPLDRAKCNLKLSQGVIGPPNTSV